MSSLAHESIFLLQRNMIKKILSRIIKDYINVKSGGIWNRNIRSRVKRNYVTFPVSPEC